VNVAELKPANCGFDVLRPLPGGIQGGWSEHLVQRYAGAALKNIALRVGAPVSDEVLFEQAGEAVLTQTGLEGSLVYAASAAVRGELERLGQAVIHLDLLPQRTAEWVAREVAHPRGPRSLSTHLKSRLNLEGVKAALLYEVLSKDSLNRPAELAHAIKNLPITLGAARPIAEAISTAGGVSFDAIDEHSMLRSLPGVFAAGEMIDWDAPTGGYLLTACLASGWHAGQGAVRFLGRGERGTREGA
jgi:hypothetical protein